MNCDDYLSMLSTVPVQELAHGRAREHADTCRDCDRVTRVVAEREYNMVTAFDNIYSQVPAAQTAARSVVIARRKKLSSYLDWGFGLAIAATVLGAVAFRMAPEPVAIGTVESTFRLQCLSAMQAADLIRGVVGSSATLTAPPAPSRTITVVTSPEGLEKVRNVLRTSDIPSHTYCALPAAPLPTPATLPTPASAPTPIAAPTPVAPKPAPLPASARPIRR